MTRVSEIFSCHTDTVVMKVQNAFDHDSYKLVSEILSRFLLKIFSRFLVSGTQESCIFGISNPNSDLP